MISNRRNIEVDRHDLFSKLVEAKRLLRRFEVVVVDIQKETNASLTIDCTEAIQAGAILAGHLNDLNEIVIKFLKK